MDDYSSFNSDERECPDCDGRGIVQDPNPHARPGDMTGCEECDGWGSADNLPGPLYLILRDIAARLRATDDRVTDDVVTFVSEACNTYFYDGPVLRRDGEFCAEEREEDTF